MKEETSRQPASKHLRIAVLSALSAIALGGMSGGNPGMFFGAGALLLTSGILFTRYALLRLLVGSTLDSMTGLALRNTARRPGRSLATIGVLASGVFMVVAVDSFRKTSDIDAGRRDSGTGGFSLIGESASPIYEDLNSQKGRDAYALDDKLMLGVKVVQMRVREGDDASCLNLNRAAQPRVIGVAPEEMAGRFAKENSASAQWEKLSAPDANLGIVPALIDANTLQWALQKKVGSLLDFTDERGGDLKLAVATTVPASILQGMVFIAESRFIEKFPNAAGYRLFLIDCPSEKATQVREHLSKQLDDRGMELVPTAQRLADFNAVENTYLSIFQILGGLGVLLGSAGLGIIVMRNVLERRREFGLLEAIGFTPAQLRSLVFSEHRWLVVAAIAIGAASAIVAVLPGIIQKGAGFPWGQLSVLFVGMGLLSAFWVWLATRIALRGSLLGSLRSE